MHGVIVKFILERCVRAVIFLLQSRAAFIECNKKEVNKELKCDKEKLRAIESFR